MTIRRHHAGFATCLLLGMMFAGCLGDDPSSTAAPLDPTLDGAGGPGRSIDDVTSKGCDTGRVVFGAAHPGVPLRPLVGEFPIGEGWTLGLVDDGVPATVIVLEMYWPRTIDAVGAERTLRIDQGAMGPSDYLIAPDDYRIELVVGEEASAAGPWRVSYDIRSDDATVAIAEDYEFYVTTFFGVAPPEGFRAPDTWGPCPGEF